MRWLAALAVASGVACAISAFARATAEAEHRLAAAPPHVETLADAVRELGEEVTRSQAGASVAELERLLATLRDLEREAAARRAADETAAAQDEAALEALYGSARWARLERTRGEIAYWKGWLLFHLAGSAEGEARRARFRDSVESFRRALPHLREPEPAREALLASAIGWRESGDPRRSADLLDRIGRRFPDAPVAFRERLRLETVRTAQARRDRASILRLTAPPVPETPIGEELLLIRLETLLEEPGAADWIREVASLASTLTDQEERSAARLVSALEAAQLDADTLHRLDLSDLGVALEGLARYREGDYPNAARLLEMATRRETPAGLRREALLLRLADAQLRSDRYDAAHGTAELLERTASDPGVRAEAARIGYAAAGRWSAADASSREARQALERASAWVIEDAPSSEEAAEIRVRRALEDSTRVAPARALRILEQLPREAQESPAVRLQRTLLLSAKLQAALEEPAETGAGVRGICEELARALRRVDEAGVEPGQLATDLALARARLRLGRGDSQGALGILQDLRSSLETERSRLSALWLAGRRAEACARAARLVREGPGSRGDRWRIAFALSQRPSPGDVPAEEVLALRDLLSALRTEPPAEAEPATRAELLVREAELTYRLGRADEASGLVQEAVQGSGSYTVLTAAATLLERMERPAHAVEVWQRASQVSDVGSPAWAAARLGVARSLRATPGRAADGCAVARSILVARPGLPAETGQELRAIADSCGDRASSDSPS